MHVLKNKVTKLSYISTWSLESQHQSATSEDEMADENEAHLERVKSSTPLGWPCGSVVGPL